MREIRNIADKLICRIDSEKLCLEIVHKGIKTIIQFNPDGTAEVMNYRIKND